MAALIHKLKILGKRRLSRRALLILCGLWCAAMLLPLILIAFDAHPVHDDFVHTQSVTQAWTQTGSVWAAIRAAWEHTQYMYRTWQGTYVAMFFSALQPMAFSPRLLFLTPLLTLIGLCLSAAYFSRNLLRVTLRTDTSTCAVFFTVLMTLLLQFLPSAREVIYWPSGTPYTLSVIMIFVILGLLIKLHMQQQPHHFFLQAGLLFLCGVVLGGCPYPLALGGTLGLLFVVAWTFQTRSPARWASVSTLAGSGLALMLVVIAPGNHLRQEVIGQPMSAAKAVLQSIAECAEMTGKWFSPQLVASALLLVLLLAPILRSSPFRFRHPFLLMTLSFGCLAASFVPPIYATGVEGYRVERVLCSLYMFYVPLMLLNLLYFTGYLIKRFENLGSLVDIHEQKGPTIAVMALSIVLMVWGLFANAIMASPSIGAAKSLLTGEAATYHQEMSLREKQIATSESAEEARSAIHPLMSVPVVLPVDMLPYQKDGGLPGLMRSYFRMHMLADEYGAGSIPQAEWDAINQ
mgnify:CR=1 FL=1